ncbi:tyrosine-type recombinase/integrase [Acidimicrobium ferrooxidans]|nr:tyrosine-type recombinase/integrase [Acidimicrobium ferrooxidans]
MARIARPTINGKRRFKVFWNDRTKGKGQIGRRWADCISGEHDEAFDAAELPASEREVFSKGATNTTLRSKLLTCYEALEKKKLVEFHRVGGAGPLFGTPMKDLLDAYEELLKRRVYIHQKGGRSRNPIPKDPGWKQRVRIRMLAPSTARGIRRVLADLRQILGGAPSGSLTPQAILDFLNQACEGLAAGTWNTKRMYVMGFLTSFDSKATSRLFRFSPRLAFEEDIPPEHVQKRQITVVTPGEIRRFLDVAEEMLELEVIEVEREREGKKETFRTPVEYSVPIIELAILYACTGIRRSEAFELRWSDIDLNSGMLSVRHQKTRHRPIPLVGDRYGDLGTGLLDLLRLMRRREPSADRVFSCQEFPSASWIRVRRKAGVDVMPQNLRRTWITCLAQIGFPSALAALWAGHGVAVAEGFYKHYIQGVCAGQSVEEVLGISDHVKRAVARARDKAPIRLADRRSAR